MFWFAGDFKVCSRDGSNLDLKSLMLSSFLLWYVAPLICMAVIYTMIAVVLWKSTAEGSIAKTSTRASVLVRSKIINRRVNYTSVPNAENNYAVQENYSQVNEFANTETQQKVGTIQILLSVRWSVNFVIKFLILTTKSLNHELKLWQNAGVCK